MECRTRSPVIFVAAGFVVVLNLLDAMFTLAYTRGGIAVEGNPLMEQALAVSPLVFMLAKLAIVSLGVLLLWRQRERLSARIGLFATSATYVLLIGYHLSAARTLVVG